MPYVNSQGNVVNKSPFSFYQFFMELYLIFTMFWKTLLAPLTGNSVADPDSASRFRDSLRGRGGGGSGGGGGGGFDGPGGGPGRRRPMGRLNTDTTSMPSCPSGGCCGG